MNKYLKDAQVVSTLATPTGSGGPIVVTSTGDKFIFSPARPIEVIRWGFIYSVAKDASATVITLDKRPTAGSNTNRATIGTISDSAARAQGAVTYQEPGTLATAAATQSTGSDGSLVNVDPIGEYKVNPGQELVVAVTTAASSTGQGYAFVEYLELPFAGSEVSGAVKIAATT